jgi:uncharacterized membrane protein
MIDHRLPASAKQVLDLSGPEDHSSTGIVLIGPLPIKYKAADY